MFDLKQNIVDLSVECKNKQKTLFKIKGNRPLNLLTVDEANTLDALISRIYSFESLIKHTEDLADIATSRFEAIIDCHELNSANYLNEIMKIFSVVSILFLPPATIGGFFGMNVLVPWQMVDLDKEASVTS